ncbi:hypothetical protein EVAR_91187_1 [Eumeta japonica]|uniref:Uncharacterized protein n=1 Tax=Eumeta variegata TaxID=151549 RepID=A0A4C1ZIC4_EUMVA|nr:hypothetical protein EVAR_91187_1 [Eumeta japonica]
MASAPCVALLSTAPAGSLRECRHRNHGFSARRYVAKLLSARRCVRACVIETMASAPYVDYQLRRQVVHVNVPSSKPWLQRRT